jgi:hypothetical protein
MAWLLTSSQKTKGLILIHSCLKNGFQVRHSFLDAVTGRAVKQISWPSEGTPAQRSQFTPVSLVGTEINFDFKDFRQRLSLCLGPLINPYWKSMTLSSCMEDVEFWRHSWNPNPEVGPPQKMKIQFCIYPWMSPTSYWTQTLLKEICHQTLHWVNWIPSSTSNSVA